MVTSTLLALTVSTPIWGKLADLFDRKVLVQTGLIIFVFGSVLAGLSTSMSWLIACRAIQGIGAGGLTALVQVILSDLVSPRERGRYAGYLGAVFGVGTVAGPLLGGVITDSAGWRWCFYIGVPFALAAFVVLQRTLDLPRRRRGVSLDYLGATLIAGGASALLIWVSLAGQSYDWISWQTAALVGAGIAAIVAAGRTSRCRRRCWRSPRAPRSGARRAAAGRAARARGARRRRRRVSRTGRYKQVMLVGTGLLTLGLALMGTLDETTSLVELGAFMVLVGAGLGMLMQNLVLVVQNAVPHTEIGSGSSLIAFFRSLGGAVGVSVLGALLASKASSSIASGLAAAGVKPSGAGDSVPAISELPPAVARIVEHAYGSGIAEIFMAAAPLGLVAMLAVALMHEEPLGTRSGIDIAREADALPQAA